MAKAKSAWEDFSSSNPYYLRSALNLNPITALAAKAADAYTKYDNGDTQGAILGMIPGGGIADKALKGDLAGAAEDVVFSQAPLVGKAYSYAMNDKQDPNTVPVEDKSTYSPEAQAERAATDATYYSDFGGGNGNGRLDTGAFENVSAYKRGGKVKAYAKGGAVSKKPVKSTKGRGDGIAQRGFTKGRII